MSQLAYYVKETDTATTRFGQYPRAPFWVGRGTYLGQSGTGNRSPHLHFGVVTDRNQKNVCSEAGIRALLKITKGSSWNTCTI